MGGNVIFWVNYPFTSNTKANQSKVLETHQTCYCHVL